MSREQLLAEAQRQIALAEARRETYAGPCTDCRHYGGRGFMWHRLHATCRNPVVEVAAFNAPGAYEKKRIIECAYQRDVQRVWGPALCGPDGVLFEPR